MTSFFRPVYLGLLCAAVLVLAAGCGKGGGSENPAEPVFKFAPRGFAAAQNVPVYDVSGKDAEWIGMLDFGDELELNREEMPRKPREWFIDDRLTLLIPVIGKNIQGWIHPYPAYAPEGARAGVVIAEKIVLGSSVSLQKGDLVVFGPEKPYPLIAPFSNDRSLDSVSAEGAVSFAEEDLEAAKFLAKARLARNAERSRELLVQGADRYPAGGVLYSLFEELLGAGEAKTGGAEPAAEALAAWFSVAQDNAPVYPKPDFSSAAIESLEQFTEVKTIERSASKSIAREGSAHWYHITEPLEGWIFGLLLEGAD